MSSATSTVTIEEVEAEYTRHMGRKVTFIILLMFMIIGLIGVATTLGVINLSVVEVYSAIAVKILPIDIEISDLTQRIVWDIRLCRILFGIVAGMGLGIAGAVMQVVLKNPLASPYTLGIASSAGFGAALAIILGHGFLGSYLIAGNAFMFSLLASMIIVGISRHKGATPEIMVLSGIAIMYLFSALTTLLQYFASPDAVREVVFWMVGSLSKGSWDSLALLCFVLAICIPFLVWKSWDYDVISSGDETAKGLGVNVERVRTMSMIIASLLVGSIVAFTGTIGFIGLVSPHIVRMIIGGDNRFVLPGSALVGGLLLSGSDVVAQHIIPPVILPIGVMTAFMGIPLFFYLIMRRRRGYW
jgi:iron complex transport system permease protein